MTAKDRSAADTDWQLAIIPPFGAEFAAGVAGERLSELDAPSERVATRDVRIPAAPTLQRAVLPSADTIAAAAERAAAG